jgi:hypothetical protein
MKFDIRCNNCRRFMSPKAGDGWEAHGEFGEDIEYVCSGCISGGAKLQAGNGSTDPRWCGVIAHTPQESAE